MSTWKYNPPWTPPPVMIKTSYKYHNYPSTLDLNNRQEVVDYIKHDMQTSLVNIVVCSGKHLQDVFDVFTTDSVFDSYRCGLLKDFEGDKKELFHYKLKEAFFKDQEDDVFFVDVSEYRLWFEILEDWSLKFRFGIRLALRDKHIIFAVFDDQIADKFKQTLQLSEPVDSVSRILVKDYKEKMSTVGVLKNKIEEVHDQHELYPFLPKKPTDLIEDYFKSKANLLFLVGSPGSGKSSLIKLIGKGKTIKLITSNNLLDTGFISGLQRDIYENADDGDDIVYVIEEAEGMLASRTSDHEGSDFTKMLLQITSGVAKIPTKIVITGNDLTTGVIDKALLRSERCFGFFEFRDLTQEEAIKASEVLGVELPQQTGSISLCDLLNGVNSYAKKIKFGF